MGGSLNCNFYAYLLHFFLIQFVLYLTLGYSKKKIGESQNEQRWMKTQ